MNATGGCAPVSPPERHLGYAVQWFALAVALVGLCVWVAVKRVQEEYRGP